jgi:capsular exopolysaccharide synthesis family protein
MGQRTGAKGLRAISTAGANPPEAFRYMAFSMVTNNTKTLRTFLFTGVKSSMVTYSSATQFATAVAKGGTRVLLVDADLLKSPITTVMNGGGKEGLSNLLGSEESKKVEDLVVPTVHENLMLLPAGTDSSLRYLTNAPQPKLEAIMQALRLYCDVVIIAVPPCDVLADAACIARLVDDVVLVVSGAQTNYRSVPIAQDLLNKAGAKAISIVMTEAQADEEPFSAKSAYIRRG